MSNAQTLPLTLSPSNPSPPLSVDGHTNNSGFLVPALPTPPSHTKPLDTPPISNPHSPILQPSGLPNVNPTSPNAERRRSVQFPGLPGNAATSSTPNLTASPEQRKRAPVAFPGASSPNMTSTTAEPSSSSADTGASDELAVRKRYHSSLSKTEIAPTGKLSRNVSGKGLGSKLQSLRKKIENELSRKRPGGRGAPAQEATSSYKRPSKRAMKGTVAGLRPSPALTVPEGMSVADASQLCAAKRTDCVLVVDDEEGLSGIFTAKDLAFRVTADGLDPRTTTVAQIMTRNPMVTRDTTSATDALQLMVSRHFRHLPVCNEDGDVVGLLDITKVFHDALAKVERSADATSQLSAALAGVQTELGPGLVGNPHTAAMMAYVDALRDRMAQPDLQSVLDTSLPPPTVSPRTSVREAARLMKERRTTAVCVLEANPGSVLSGVSNRENPPKIAGIFTSKDIVLRVIAAGLDAARCSVVRVMTPHPDTAPPAMIVQDALKKMHNGHYLNLPVVEDDGRLIGIVDVLKLTYATLEQIESMNEERTTEAGPMWGKFFDTLNTAGADDDTHSALSVSEVPDSPSSKMLGHQRGLSSVTSPISEVMPGDSASVVGEMSEIGMKTGASSVAPAPLPVDDGTYVFKFKTPSGRTHRFQARHDNYELLRDIVHGKLSVDPFFDTPEDPTAPAPDPSIFTLSYTDDDGDLVEITADGDVSDAVAIARGQKTDRIVLYVNGGKSWEEAARLAEPVVEVVKAAEPEPVPEPPAAPIAPAPVVAAVPIVVEEDVEAKLSDPNADPAKVPTYGASGAHAVHAKLPPQPEDLIFGVLPKDLALPAAIGFLGVVIAGVFVASRASK